VDAVFYTVSDSRFFAGTVALLNSLRITGHEQELVVLDNGLTAEQSEQLEHHATVFRPEAQGSRAVYSLSPFPYLLEPKGVVAMIDSDLIVTAPLTPALERAERGQIAACREEPGCDVRWFAEWGTMLALQAPLRREEYLNAGFVVFSTEHWPDLLARWWNLCAEAPRCLPGERRDHPLTYHDQDVLNAILMSEVPAGNVSNLPETEMIYGSDSFDGLKIVSRDRLTCLNYSQRVSLLHHDQRPKVWSADGQVRALRLRDPYVKLLPRVLFDKDVPTRLNRKDYPWWVRGRLSTRVRLNLVWFLGRVRGRVAVRTRAQRLRDSWAVRSS
jgi:hypothetical protein